MAMDKSDELGGLWLKTSGKGLEYLTGEIGGVKVVAFRNTKKTADNQPEWRVYKSKPRDDA